MAIVQTFKSLDTYFMTTTGSKIIINDLDPYSVDDLDTINNSLMTVYDSDVISTIPKCDCGELEGKYLLGKECLSCGTKVTDPLDQLDPILWMQAIDKNMRFMNPHYWLMLRNIISSKIDGLRWLSDTSYNPPVEIPPFLYEIKDMIGDRNYANLIDNLGKVLSYLKQTSKFRRTEKEKELDFLLLEYETNRGNLFNNYMPIVNKKLFVMEVTTKGKFTNLTVSDMIDLVMVWVKAANNPTNTPRKLSNTMGSVQSKLASLYETYYNTYIATKVGIFRKHVFSFRSHFTFRGVIASIPGKCSYDEVHVPWTIGVTAFRPHILNKLVKQRGYTYKKAKALLYKAVNIYDQDISECLDELIEEAPGKGIAVIMQRNQLGSLVQ